VCVLVSLRRSVLFPLISLVILLVGEIIAIFSHYDRRKKVLTFVSGILFVIAGQCHQSVCLSPSQQFHKFERKCTWKAEFHQNAQNRIGVTRNLSYRGALLTPEWSL